MDRCRTVVLVPRFSGQPGAARPVPMIRLRVDAVEVVPAK